MRVASSRRFLVYQPDAETCASPDGSTNAAWQRDLSFSCWVIAAKVFQPQERWAEAGK